MDQKQIETWSQTVDESDNALIDDELPDAEPGTILTKGQRKWQRVIIQRGQVGSRWAYWLSLFEGRSVGHIAIADRIFNGDAPHFIGMLKEPFSGRLNTPAWVLIEPKMAGVNERHTPEPKPDVRYEKSNEIFDVQTGQTRKI